MATEPNGEPEKWGNYQVDGVSARGDFDSREDAIADGMAEYEGEPFCIGVRVEMRMRDFSPRASGIQESIECQVFDNCGPDSKISFEGDTDEFERRLGDLVEEFFKCDWTHYYDYREKVNP